MSSQPGGLPFFINLVAFLSFSAEIMPADGQVPPCSETEDLGHAEKKTYLTLSAVTLEIGAGVIKFNVSVLAIDANIFGVIQPNS